MGAGGGGYSLCASPRSLSRTEADNAMGGKLGSASRDGGRMEEDKGVGVDRNSGACPEGHGGGGVNWVTGSLPRMSLFLYKSPLWEWGSSPHTCWAEVLTMVSGHEEGLARFASRGLSCYASQGQAGPTKSMQSSGPLAHACSWSGPPGPSNPLWA